MSTSWNSVAVRCPYYKFETDTAISCEAPFRKASGISVKFSGKNAKEKFQETHCNAEWESCELSQLCTRKYN